MSLAEQVAERQALVVWLVDESSTLLDKYGECTGIHEYDCYTKRTLQLKNFAGFSFYHYGAYTMFGGEILRIWQQDVLVFEAEWWDIQKANVKIFVHNDWHKELAKVFSNAEEFAKLIKDAKVAKNQAAILKQQAQEENIRLESEAKRLKLI